MKKRLISILTVIACVLMLAGCGSGQTADPDAVPLTETEQQQWLDAAVAYVQSIQAAAEEGAVISADDDPVNGPVYESWCSALPEIGTVGEIRGDTVAFTKKEGRITVHVDGSIHDAEVVLNLEKANGSYDLSGATVNVQYSFGELIEKAGLNTVLGMGTTFAVLILLAILILLFGRILNFTPKEKTVVREERAPVPAAAEPETAAAEVQPEEPLETDLALIAVITAAVAAFEQKSTGTPLPPEEFVVRSIRKARKKF